MCNLTINYSTGIARQLDVSNLVSYSEQYWAKYQNYRNSPESQAINQARLSLISRYPDRGQLTDIGIGNGQFCESANCNGYDINPIAVQWLQERNRYLDPYSQQNDSLSFWDCLEHMIDPTIILKTITRYAFISIPIVQDWNTIEQWKHFRPNEHLWYFTEAGLIEYMKQNGFIHCETNNAETLAGRQDILSFAFRRSHA